VRSSIRSKTLAIVSAILQSTAYVADLDFYRDLVAFAKKHEISFCRLLCRGLFRQQSAASCCRFRAIDVKSNSPRFEDVFDADGAWDSRSARAHHRCANAVKSYLDYGAFTPSRWRQPRADGPEDCIREMRDTYRKRRDALVESFGRAGWEFRRPHLDVRMGAVAEGVPRGRQHAVRYANVEKSGVVCRWRCVRRACEAIPHRNGGKRATHPPGRARRAPLLESGIERCTTWFLSPTAIAHSLIPAVFNVMVAPLKVGIAGLALSRRVVRLIEAQSRSRRALRPWRARLAVTARSKTKKRNVTCAYCMAKNALDLANDPGVDCFVELMGGSGEPALSAIEAA